MTQQAHYPSSAELAAFRRRIAPQWASSSPGITETVMIDGRPSPFVGPAVGSAWPRERQHGIGHRYGWSRTLATGGMDPFPHLPDRPGIARREAAAMRSHDAAR